ASYIEVVNIGKSALALADYSLRIAPSGPGLAPPGADAGTLLAWPSESLGPGAHMIVTVTDADVAAIEANPEREGVVSAFAADGTAVDRIDFMQLPADAVLARVPDRAHMPSLCTNATPEAESTHCDPLEHREVGDRLRYLSSPGDFRALAAGGPEVGLEAVKFVLDMEAGDTVHLLGSERWALHYTFIRERIEGNPPLDRCIPAQDQEFNAGWFTFSQKEYFKPEGRRYLLGTLVYHASGMHTVEFTSGDAILGEQMRRAFFAVVAHTSNPHDWFLRASDDYQVNEARKVEGTLPIVGPNAPFVGLRYQPLTRAVGYGVLRFVPSDDIAESELGPRVILVTDDVPNDIPFVGGLITESFQTPLAHVNVLSQSRGTPNMALRGAHLDERLTPLFDKLVRLEVGSADLDVREATPEEADAFWIAQRPDRPPIVPPIDTSVRGVQALPGLTIDALPAVGAKAAQYAELYRVTEVRAGCPQSTLPLNVPRDAFAIPVVHYLEHFAASGAEDKLRSLLTDASFRADPIAHERGLADVRNLILEHPVEPELLAEVTAAVGGRFGRVRVRFRSSSNSEDLPEFNGAGLHTSVSVELGDRDRDLQNGLRTVWASLWNTRAFDERDFANVEQTAAAMAVLVHEAELGEAAQGVAIARALRDLTRLEVYYLNAQRGEASVTNPAPGVTTEELLFTFPPRTPTLEYLSSSSLGGDGPVLPGKDAHGVACALASVQLHFRPLLDPGRENRLFAMQIEWKLERGTRDVIVKQARPQPFGAATLPADCREFQ
ncbi:MAG TPA: PEP/pyruvate-binding domain-containing protein, partial [Polyangiales bacterium]|nr:PEP/pyruvate-binding domain-containing protein [Polyangiales bacterium]